MKDEVTIEELNAATMLILGIPVNRLVEVHVTSTNVSGIAIAEDGSIGAVRIRIATPATPAAPVEDEEVGEPVDAELVEDDS